MLIKIMVQSSAGSKNNYGQLVIGNTNDMGDDSGEMGDNLPSVNL